MDRQLKILIADDSSAMITFLSETLTTGGNIKFSVIIAQNGLEACSMANHERPDLILMDIEMPVMTGIEAVRKIKNHDPLKAIPIIVMSSSKLFNDAIKAGADDIILKPFSQYELLLRVNMNINLALKASEIKKQQEMLQIKEQESSSQRDIIKNQQRELLDDLTYASFIQKAVLTESFIFKEISSSHFIYNRPKNIVSGDFYWISKKNDLVFFAVGDCTGHGLSGALMTMVGYTHLNEIVNNSNKTEPHLMLNDLRTIIINMLHQKGKIGEVSNGMDIALCVLNISNNSIQYSGANNPLYIIRVDGKLDIIEADKMPVGIYINNERSFSCKTFQLNRGDNLYLFSDGYPDQFGGPDSKKFKYSRFRELLVNISDKSSDEQLSIIDQTMKTWMGNSEQVDDMLILGIKF